MQAMTLRLPDEVHEALRREAFESRRSMNDLVLKALSDRAAIWDEGVTAGAFWEFEDNRSHESGGTAVSRPKNPYRDGE